MAAFRFQLIVDRYRPPEQVARLVSAGVDALQIRIRNDSTARLLAYVRELRDAVNESGTFITVNGRTDIALAAGGDGVHLPAHGAPIQPVRDVAPSLVIGASVHSVEQALAAEEAGADYLTYGHVFASASHPGEPGRGLAALRNVASAVAIPVIAIGGVRPGRVAPVRAAGATGFAVIGAVWEAPEPEWTVRQMREEWDRCS